MIVDVETSGLYPSSHRVLSIAATATLDAGTTETTLLLAEIYLRARRWRVRAVGQGYDSGLATLAEQYGVNVE